MRFKVPTLRNVALTYPYFHDGAFWHLEDAVDVLPRFQLVRKLSSDKVSQIVAFLDTQTGEQPNFKLSILPPSSRQAPRPAPLD